MLPTFTAVAEDVPGPRWQAFLDAHASSYRDWYLQDGDRARPTYAACARALREHMPELVPTYERLVELGGGSDTLARLLTLWQPPAYLTACSQAAWTREEPLLVRNYDYDPARFEATIVRTHWGRHAVIGSSDSLWGLLDGVNDAGLAASLTFGGSLAVGPGFGVPLVVRYLLETCRTTADARAVLDRIPVHQAYNVTVVDAVGAVLTAHLGPGRDATFCATPIATNHQAEVEWEEHATATRSLERQGRLVDLLTSRDTSAESLVGAFLAPPLYATEFDRAFATLYTAAYRPEQRSVTFVWPGVSWHQSVDAFAEGTLSPGAVGATA